jgi:glyoxylase-like metal-dependent hydrolase (beta-lactamase superfamily II)
MRPNLDFTCDYCTLESVAPGIRRIVAENPGPFTFLGTGTYVVGRGEVAVIDPGPDQPAHVEALLAQLDPGERVSHILVTHTHRDHSPAARLLRARTGAPTYGFGPHGGGDHEIEAGADIDFAPDVTIGEGAVIEGGDWRLEALQTPGHTSNHLCFAFPREGVLFPGDHVMGWSTTVIQPPDGDMADYMAQLRRLRLRDDRTYWPTHGAPILQPGGHLDALIAHRLARRAKVLAALDATPRRPMALVPLAYEASLDRRLHSAAAQSLLAHLLELAGEGLARETPDGWRRA